MPDGSPRNEPADRRSEWFVPSFGPERFRLAVGLLFLPYTGMVLAYTVMGSMLAAAVHWDRVVGIVAIYFLALGVGAHQGRAVFCDLFLAEKVDQHRGKAAWQLVQTRTGVSGSARTGADEDNHGAREKTER